MKRIRWSFAGACLLLACHGGHHPIDIPDGGPCSYKTMVSPATLVALHDISNQEYDAEFALERDNSGKTDTLYYSTFNNYHYLRRDELPKDSLQIGKQYTYEEQKIVSGSCVPDISTIRLVPYQPPK
ncbi:MAG: hypothetical protein U0X40_04545 [Ferruginibacter sp.]